MDQALSLSAEEVMVLTDRVRNDDCGTEDMRVATYPLLLKLGSSFVEMLENNKKEGTIEVRFSESELWLLRERVSSADKTSSDALFGVKLLCKIYRALLACTSEVTLTEGEETGEAMTAEKREALSRFHAINTANERREAEGKNGAEDQPNPDYACD